MTKAMGNNGSHNWAVTVALEIVGKEQGHGKHIRAHSIEGQGVAEMYLSLSGISCMLLFQ